MINKPQVKKCVSSDTKRPMITDYINELFTDFTELHGDRYFGRPCHPRQRWQLLQRHTGDGNRLQGTAPLSRIWTPTSVWRTRRGYRALRLASGGEIPPPGHQHIDTTAARLYGVGAEGTRSGRGHCRCLYEFIELKTPVISIVTGEGGSGGLLLALAVADRVLMLENALYSVTFRRAAAPIHHSLEGPKREAEAADTLHIAQDLYSFGMIEGIIQEGISAQLIRNVGAHAAQRRLAELDAEPDIGTMLQKRYEKFRRVGVSEQ